MLPRAPAVLLSLISASAALAWGCGSENASAPRQAEVVSPASGVRVTATVAGASLGDGAANIQIAFVATDAPAIATISVTDVALVDASTGETVDSLKATTPSVWNGQFYERWNQQLPPGGDLKASYQLSSSKWSMTGVDSTARDPSAYSRTYTMRVTLRVDGAEVRIESGELQREPAVMT